MDDEVKSNVSTPSKPASAMLLPPWRTCPVRSRRALAGRALVLRRMQLGSFSAHVLSCPCEF